MSLPEKKHNHMLMAGVKVDHVVSALDEKADQEMKVVMAPENANVNKIVTSPTIANDEKAAQEESKILSPTDKNSPTPVTATDEDDTSPVTLIQVAEDAGFVTLRASKANQEVDAASAEIDKEYSKKANVLDNAVEHNLATYQKVGAKEAQRAWRVAQMALNAQVSKDTRFEAKEPLTLKTHAELINSGAQQILKEDRKSAAQEERQLEHDLQLKRLSSYASLEQQMAQLKVSDDLQAASNKPQMQRAMKEADPHMPIAIEQEGYRYSEKHIKSQQKLAVEEVDFHENQLRFAQNAELRALSLVDNQMKGEQKAVDIAVDPIINGKKSDTHTIPAHQKWYTPGDGRP
jgi:hypothetical protein